MSPTLTGQLEESYSSITNLGGVFRNGYGVLLERSIGSIDAAGKETTPTGAMRLEVETHNKSKDYRHLVSDCKVIHFRPHFFDDTSAIATAKPRVLRDEVQSERLDSPVHRIQGDGGHLHEDLSRTWLGDRPIRAELPRSLFGRYDKSHQQNAGIRVLGWPVLGSVREKDTQCAASRWRTTQPNIKNSPGDSAMKMYILGWYCTERADYWPASHGIALEPNYWSALGASAMDGKI